MDAPIQKIKSYCKNKKNIISLAQGLPWFGPPPQALRKAVERIQKGEGHKYGPDEGNYKLRFLLSNFLKSLNIKGSLPENIIITPGANQAAFLALATISDKGDEIILFRPYYFNHLMAVQILGLKPVIVETDDNYHIDPDVLRSKISNKTKAIILVSPSNPTGAMIDFSILSELLEIAYRYGIYIISDEPYFHFVWEKKHFSPLTFDDTLTIGLWSFSKSYGMSGWRLGWMKVPNFLVQHIIKVADTLHVCPPVPSQILAEEVMLNFKDYPFQFLSDIKKSRDILIQNLLPAVERGVIDFPKNEGGFYIFIKFRKEKRSGWEIAKILIDRYGLATVPGEPFGMREKAYLRLSFGNLPPHMMEKASEILKKSLLFL
ncbi:aminotransferase class I/II-fold pyridoxal phosphate-dependent enzyme [Candidatus Aminicenantes bacterium AC-335-O07]|nr:aminotransferase class I/II-fold pyridoxal phosphate-dependent enzyme [Candidatus Aminicenantes bacterium AC-335-O07]